MTSGWTSPFPLSLSPLLCPRHSVQAYRIVVSAKTFLFRASVPSTSLRAGPSTSLRAGPLTSLGAGSEAAGSSCQGQRTRYKGQSKHQGLRTQWTGATGLLPLSSPPCPSSRGVLTLGFWSPVTEARSQKPRAANWAFELDPSFVLRASDLRVRRALRTSVLSTLSLVLRPRLARPASPANGNRRPVIRA